MRFSRLVYWLLPVLLITSCNWSTGFAPESPKTWSDESPNQVRPGEIFVQLFPRDGYLHVKEYHLDSLLESGEIPGQITAIQEKVVAVEYSVSEYQFETFQAEEESWFRDRDFVTGEYHLKSSEPDLQKLINDSFAKLLRRPVTLKITDTEIIIQFEATDLRVADNNALGVYVHNETNWQRLVFRNGQRSFDAVFTLLHEDEAESLAPYFAEDVQGERISDP